METGLRGPRGHHFCRLTLRDDGVEFEIVMLAEDGSWSVVERFLVPVERVAGRGVVKVLTTARS